MTVQITVVGLGQIGSSVGLALAKYPERIKRIGYDRVLETQNKAKESGAFDAVKFNLPSAIEGADVVVLCIPLDQVDETLRLIAPDLREDAVVLDFSPQKSAAYQYFQKHIPAGRHYIGLVSTVNPMCLDQVEHGVEAARVDLFENATFGIAAPARTSSEAMKLAADLVELLGAQTIYLDMLEADGMELTSHLLPQIVSAALLNATVGQPGWTEARRFAGRPYAQTISALGSDTPEALSEALMHNPLGTASALDNLIGALTHMRIAIENGDRADLQKRIDMAGDDREIWLKQRMRADWDGSSEETGAPKVGGIFKRLFWGGAPKEKK